MVLSTFNSTCSFIENCHVLNGCGEYIKYSSSIAAPTEKKAVTRTIVSSCSSPTKSKKNIPVNKVVHVEGKEISDIPLHMVIQIYIWYAVKIIFGHLRDFLRAIGMEKTVDAIEKNREGYVPLYQSFESFYIRNIYRRVRSVCNQPISSIAGEVIDIMDRKRTDGTLTGTTTRAINFGSYNYLGFAENTGPRVDNVESVIRDYGVGVCSTRNELGTHTLHSKLEETVSRFIGAEDAIVFGMGFATNSTNIPTIAGPGCLVISDELNHASMIVGIRLSGATTRTFKHNNMLDLEKLLRQAIVEGQPRSHRPWKKIIIFVEGIYSMEGTAVNLPEVIALKKKYKAYLYLDEAHSIGAMGPTGRGIVEYFDCDPKDVDLLMGTFTKSFGAAGGYIAGSKQLIDHIRIHSHSFSYATSMAPPVVQQVISVFETLQTSEGKKKIETLRQNSIYFRKRLKELGFSVYGRDDSPVVPILIYFLSNGVYYVHESRKLGVATVGCGFPAVPLLEPRVRFCISASHTKEMLDHNLEIASHLGDKMAITYIHNPKSGMK